MAQKREEFDPAKYSEEENALFVKHMGESPLAALQSPLPEGVNPVTVEKVLGRTYELEQLKEHKGVTWIGLQRIANACTIFLNQRARWRKLAERGSPTFPTMHAWDGKGRPHRGGIGSDSGHVRTYFTEDGDRRGILFGLLAQLERVGGDGRGVRFRLTRRTRLSRALCERDRRRQSQRHHERQQ